MPGIAIKVSTSEAQTATKKLYADLNKLGAETKLTTQEIAKLESRMQGKLGADKADAAIKRLGESVGLTKSEVQKFHDKLSPPGFADRVTRGYSAIKANWVGLAGAAGAVGVAAYKAFDYIQRGAKELQAEDAFRRTAASMGEDADKMLAKLDRAAAGVVDDGDIMQKAVKGLMQGFSGDQLVRMMETARVSARVAGQDIKDTYQTITDAISTNMPRSLKQYGLITTQEMSLVNKALAAGIEDVNLYEIAMANATVQTAKMGEMHLTAAEKIERFKMKLEDTKDIIGVWLIELPERVAKFSAAAADAEAGITLVDNAVKASEGVAAWENARKLRYAYEQKAVLTSGLKVRLDTIEKEKKANEQRAAKEKEILEINRKAKIEIEQLGKNAYEKEIIRINSEAAEYKKAGIGKTERAKFVATQKELAATKAKEIEIAASKQAGDAAAAQYKIIEEAENKKLDLMEADAKQYQALLAEESDFASTENERAINKIISDYSNKIVRLNELQEKGNLTYKEYETLKERYTLNKNRAILENETETAKKIADLNYSLIANVQGKSDVAYEKRLEQITAEADVHLKNRASIEAVYTWINDEVNKAYIQMGQSGDDWTKGAIAGLKSLEAEHKKWGTVSFDIVREFSHSAQSELSDNFFAAMTFQFDEFKWDWNNLWNGVARIMSDKLAQMVVEFVAAQATMANVTTAVDWVSALFASEGIWELKGSKDGIPVIAHPGEMIVPADAADQVRNSMAGSGYGQTFEGMADAVGPTTTGRVTDSFLSGTAGRWGKIGVAGAAKAISGQITTDQLISGLLSPQALMASVLGGGVPSAIGEYLGLDSTSKMGYSIGATAAGMAVGGPVGMIAGVLAGTLGMLAVEGIMDSLDKRDYERIKDLYEDTQGWWSGHVAFGKDLATGYFAGDEFESMQPAAEAAAMIAAMAELEGWGYDLGRGGEGEASLGFGGISGEAAKAGGYEGGSFAGFAEGGKYSSNRPFWVGEKGAEIVLPRQGQVLSHEDSIAFARRYGKSIPGYALGTTPSRSSYADDDSYNLAVSQRSLEIQLMELQGRTLEALTARRDLELSQMNESLQATMKEIYAQSDLNIAMEEATALATQKRSLEIQLMELQGDSAGALAAQRQAELDAMSESLRPIAQAIYAQQDLNTANEEAAVAAEELADQERELADQRQAVADENRSITMRIYEEMGDEESVLAMKRKQELDAANALDASLGPLLQALYDLEDANTATRAAVEATAEAEEAAAKQAAEALEISNRTRGLQIDLLKAEGKAQEALNKEREDTLSGLDNDEQKQLQKDIWALTDAAEALTEAAEKSSQLAAVANTRQGLWTQFIQLANQTGNTAAIADYQRILKVSSYEGWVEWQLADLRHGLAGVFENTEAWLNTYIKIMSLESELSQLTEQRHSKEIELLEALGYSEEALAMQRLIELEAMDESTRTIQLQIWAVQDLTESMGKYKSRIEEIDNFVNELSLSKTLAPVLSAQSYTNQYNKLRAAAMGEGATNEDVSKYLSYAQEYLEFQRSYGNNYQALYSEVMADVMTLRSQSQNAYDIAEMQLDAIKTQTQEIINLGERQLGILTQLLHAAIGYYPDQHASGGLTLGPTITGEIGPEWNVPTYEPQRSSFLEAVGADPETLGKSIAKYILMATGGGGDIHVSVQVDGKEIAHAIAKQTRTNSELIGAIRKVA